MDGLQQIKCATTQLSITGSTQLQYTRQGGKFVPYMPTQMPVEDQNGLMQLCDLQSVKRIRISFMILQVFLLRQILLNNIIL